MALCLGFNLPEVSENNQTKLLEKSTKCPLKSTPRLLVVTLMWRKFRTYLNLYEWFDYFRQGHLKFVLDYSGCRRSNVRPAPYGLRSASPYRKFANRKFFLKVGCKIIYKMATNGQVGTIDR